MNDWFESVSFPSEIQPQLNPNTVTSTPQKQPLITQAVEHKMTYETYTSHQPSYPQKMIHQPMNKLPKNPYQPSIHQNESEETRAKKILNKLSDAFDQPERRTIIFE